MSSGPLVDVVRIAITMTMSPEDKISRLAHEITVELMKQSLVEIRARLTAHPQ